ncbi:MAG: DUF6677 family protein, partial [Planctomycetota bacterium]
GHLYQKRYLKAAIYAIAIMSLWVTGFGIGGSHVVYAARNPGDFRWQFLFQVPVGGPSLPAIAQAVHMSSAMSKSRDVLQFHNSDFEPMWGGFMAAPVPPSSEDIPDETSAWFARHGLGVEMGTWYTMIAGLLNLFAIYDAFGGPLSIPISGRVGESPETASSDADEEEMDGTSDDNVSSEDQDAGKQESVNPDDNPDDNGTASDNSDSNKTPKS